MKKIALISLFLAGALSVHGCTLIESGSALSEFSRIDRDCPFPSNDQLENGYLKLQDGVTLKCQVKNFTHTMSCVGVTDSTESDGWACSNGKSQILFIFDENNVLKSHKGSGGGTSRPRKISTEKQTRRRQIATTSTVPGHSPVTGAAITRVRGKWSRRHAPSASYFLGNFSIRCGRRCPIRSPDASPHGAHPPCPTMPVTRIVRDSGTSLLAMTRSEGTARRRNLESSMRSGAGTRSTGGRPTSS